MLRRLVQIASQISNRLDSNVPNDSGMDTAMNNIYDTRAANAAEESNATLVYSTETAKTTVSDESFEHEYTSGADTANSVDTSHGNSNGDRDSAGEVVATDAEVDTIKAAEDEPGDTVAVEIEDVDDADNDDMESDDDRRDSFEILDLAWQVVMSEMQATIDIDTIVAVLEDESLSPDELDDVQKTVVKLRTAIATVARASLEAVR